MTVQINSFDKRSEKKEYRIGNGMFKDWKWNVRTQNSFEACGGRGGSAAEADPLSRSFDLRKIDIDQLSLIHSTAHKGAAHD